MIGITMKKIMIKAWAVTIVLYSWSSNKNPLIPDNSPRINKLRALPIIALQPPKIKYNVPISLWLVENSHRLISLIILCHFKATP
jgi:hypothetical protein